jgi:hypothetical protein
MGQPVGGTAYIFVDGAQYPLRGNLTVMPSRVQRTGVAGQDKIHGYTEAPVVPYIEMDLTTQGEIGWDVFENYTDCTVQADLINGRSYVLRNAWVSNPREINTAQGMTHVRFEGLSCTEIGG